MVEKEIDCKKDFEMWIGIQLIEKGKGKALQQWELQ